MDYDNDQYEIVEHQIDKPELFHVHYKKFKIYQLLNPEKKF